MDKCRVLFTHSVMRHREWQSRNVCSSNASDGRLFRAHALSKGGNTTHTVAQATLKGAVIHTNS